MPCAEIRPISLEAVPAAADDCTHPEPEFDFLDLELAGDGVDRHRVDPREAFGVAPTILARPPLSRISERKFVR